MVNLTKQIQEVHSFSMRQRLYPVLFSTAVAIAFFITRVYISRSVTFIFLVWNLFLAWVPYLASFWAASLHQRYPKRWWLLLVPGGLWLAFFPNAPYIVTDFLHLSHRPPVPMWFDVGFLATFAWTGLFLAVFSLHSMQTLVKSYFGAFVGWIFVLAILGLSGLGVYMGRFLRWNSWDLLVHPKTVVIDILYRLAHPFSNLQTLGVTLMFSVFLLICYLTLTTISQRQSNV